MRKKEARLKQISVCCVCTRETSPPEMSALLTLAAKILPPNLKLLLISSPKFGAYCIHLQTLSWEYNKHTHGMWEASIQNLSLMEVLYLPS